jgi:mitogen-activated protein kinase kinase
MIFASKKIFVNKIDADYINKKIEDEFNIAKDCRHPNIGKKVFDTLMKTVEHYYHYFDDFNSEHVIIMEYMEGGSIEDMIKKNKVNNSVIGENMTKIYVSQILHGLEHLHCIKNIIHRDIKPANLLIADTGNVKISDFGESKYLNQGGMTIKGTPLYMAPEILDVNTNILRTKL